MNVVVFLQNTSITCEADRSGSNYRLGEDYQVHTPPFPSCLSVRAHKMFGSAPNSTSDHTPTPTTTSPVAYSYTIMSDSTHSHMSIASPNPPPSSTPDHTSGPIPNTTISTSHRAPIYTPIPTPSHTPNSTAIPVDQASEFMSNAEMALRWIGTEIAAAFNSTSSSKPCSYGDRVHDTCMRNYHPSSRPHQDGCHTDRNKSSLFLRGRLKSDIKLLNFSISNFRDYNQVIGQAMRGYGLIKRPSFFTTSLDKKKCIMHYFKLLHNLRKCQCYTHQSYNLGRKSMNIIIVILKIMADIIIALPQLLSHFS